MNFSAKLDVLVLTCILLLGFLVRLYHFDNPVADWHSWRQADTSAVSRNFVQNGFDLLHPKFDDLSNVPSGLDNPQGFRFVEFPIYNLFQAGLFRIFGVFSLEQWGRLVTIFSSLFSAVFIFLIIKKRFGVSPGLLSAFFFLFLPFNIYYSRTILPDPSMAAATLSAIYFFDKWIEKDKKQFFFLSLIFMAAAFLLKPYALFFTLPIIYLAYEKYGFTIFKNWKLWIYIIFSLIPLVFWRIWMLKFPQGIPASLWLFNSNHIRFRPSFFYWIFYVRLLRLILGFFGIFLLALAFLKKYKRKDLFFILSFVFSSLLYICILATGNVQHDYYQILIIPSVAILLGLGANTLLNIKSKFKYFYVSLLLISIVLAFALSWNLVKDYFNINNPSIIAAGKAVDKLTPKDAKVIANYNGDTSFLYQTKRKGWASFEKPLPEMIRMGAGYLILTNPTSVDLQIGKTYKIIDKTNQYVIFNLNLSP